ncbi:NUDIX hydrolase [Paenibacillus sp. R14(2021)]|uniref:NUDIX hydrolase n=1 Tax=Paenibacillus sp. R14(2021) TaxID=2859228 RepID=UPI001C612E49|nr:NUDIX domain-containing protein [Paenibacillus sp. R14(2021)]
MQGYNVLLVYNNEMDRLLMCKRLKEPYLGLSNLVGGKIESGESGMEAAYRELYEETSITRGAITLHHLMDFKYYLQDCYVEVYAGKLNGDAAVSGDENELYWSDLDRNFFDMTLYAGEGNIGHMIEQVKMSLPFLFERQEA